MVEQKAGLTVVHLAEKTDLSLAAMKVDCWASSMAVPMVAQLADLMAELMVA